MYVEKLQLDRKFGFGSENANAETFRAFLDCPDLKQNSQFELFDYESDEYLIELKTRRCKSNTYPDTMIPKNKIDFCKTSNKTIYFFFQFIDGMFFWKYKHNQLNRECQVLQAPGTCMPWQPKRCGLSERNSSAAR